MDKIKNLSEKLNNIYNDRENTKIQLRKQKNKAKMLSSKLTYNIKNNNIDQYFKIIDNINLQNNLIIEFNNKYDINLDLFKYNSACIDITGNIILDTLLYYLSQFANKSIDFIAIIDFFEKCYENQDNNALTFSLLVFNLFINNNLIINLKLKSKNIDNINNKLLFDLKNFCQNISEKEYIPITNKDIEESLNKICYFINVLNLFTKKKRKYNYIFNA